MIREDIFLGEWARRHPGFVRDGIADASLYFAAPFRVIYLMKEVNAPRGEIRDLRAVMRGGGRAGTTWENVARWTIGIFDIGRDIPWRELECVSDGRRAEALARVGIVNVKKTAGGHTCSESALWRAGQENGPWLREQLRLCEPELIICCGTWAIYREFIGGGSPAMRTPHGLGYSIDRGSVVIDYIHPMARIRSSVLYYGLIDEVRIILETPFDTAERGDCDERDAEAAERGIARRAGRAVEPSTARKT